MSGNESTHITHNGGCQVRQTKTRRKHTSRFSEAMRVLSLPELVVMLHSHKNRR